MFCHKCGNKLPEGSGFCNGCGAKLVAADTTQPSETPSNPDEAVSPPTETAQVLEDASVTAQEALEAQPFPVTTTAASRRDSLLRFAKISRLVGFGILTLLFLSTIFGFINVHPIIAIFGGILVLVGEGISEFYRRRYVRLILTSLVAITLCVVVIVAFNHARNDGTTPTASVTSGNRYVQMVRNGSPVTWPNVTYDEAFSNFFGSPRWSHFESDDGLQVVQFTGDMEYGGSPVNALIQFIVDMESGTFDATFLSFNEVPQTQLMLLTLITTVFGESGEAQQRETTQATFGSTFEYLGLEITIASSRVTDDEQWQHQIKIPVTVTNISSVDVSLMSISATAWTPDGLSLGIAFGAFGADALTSIRPGATLETFIIFYDDGDGTYEVEFTEFLGDGSVGVTITLPISRDGGAVHQPTTPTTNQDASQIAHELVGRWRVIDAYNNWLFPDTGMVEFDIIEFFADGTGSENKDGTEFGFEWQVTGAEGRSLVINYSDRELSVFYEIFDSQLLLMLEAGPPAVFNRMDVSAPPAANQGTGFVDHNLTLGGTSFVISTPPDWSYEMDWDGPGVVILAGDVPSGRIGLYVSELWWASSIDEAAQSGNRVNDFDFIDGHNGLRITSHEDWGTLQFWIRDDMWLYAGWFQIPDLLDYFDLITDIAASLRPR